MIIVMLDLKRPWKSNLCDYNDAYILVQGL